MSLSSRKLLTKIYDLDLNIPGKPNKKKNTQDYSLFKNKLKSRKNNDRKNIFEINKTEKGNNILNKNKLRLGNSNKTIEINKFPVIPTLNIRNIKIKEENGTPDETKEQKNMLLLDYKLIESSSEDDNHKLRDLKNGLNGPGWQSERFCQYPQYIYIQFIKPVLIRKIELILPEKNIPSIIRFFSYYPKDIQNNFLSNYKDAEYDLVGFIKTNSNENTNFQSRELHKIYPNVKSLFFKLELEKNYLNMYNLFNQVGLMKLDFYGEYLDYIGGSKNNNELQIKHALKINFDDDVDLIGICDKQLKELKKKMIYNIEIEDYMECKKIKYKIEKIRLYGKKLYELESERMIALNNEDYSKALSIKNNIDKLKIDVLNISNLNLTKINDNKLILSDRFIEQKNSKKIIQPLLSNIQGKPKIYKLNNTNEDINNVLTTDNNFTNTIDNIISYDETILPTVLNKYNPHKEENETINEIEKGKLEAIPRDILNEYEDITKVLGEENMQKIFSKQYLWKEEGLNILFEKIEEIIQDNNNNYKGIISSIFKLCLLLMEETHPSSIIKIFEIIKKIFNYMNDKKIKIKLEKNITDGILYKIKKKLSDINIKIRTKAVLLYSFLICLNICDFYNLIEELIKQDDNNNTNLILAKLDILINILNCNDQSIKKKLLDKQKFPFNLIIEYLINNLNNYNNHEVRKKSRFCIKLFFEIYGGTNKFKNYFDKINPKELDELMKEIPNFQNHFPTPEKHEETPVNKKDINIKGYKMKIKINPSKKIPKLFFKKNQSLSVKNKEKIKKD